MSFRYLRLYSCVCVCVYVCVCVCARARVCVCARVCDASAGMTEGARFQRVSRFTAKAIRVASGR